MSQLVFIILINLVVLLTAALSLGLFFFLRHRKQHEQTINRLLSGISKQQSGRAEALQQRLGTDSQAADEHSDTARALAMAENTFYQQFVASLLDRTGKKLTQLPDTVQTLLDHYVNTLADRPQYAADVEASEPNTVDEPAPAEAGAAEPVLDNSDDIEVTLDLDELDEADPAAAGTSEPVPNDADDLDINLDLNALDVPETGEVSATESTLDDSDDIEVTLDIDELDEAESVKARANEPVSDDADELEIELDLDALEEADAAQAGASDPLPDDVGDLDLNALDQSESAETGCSEPVSDDSDDLEVDLDLDALDEADAAEAGTHEPVPDDNDGLEASLEIESTAPDSEHNDDVAAENPATPLNTPEESSSTEDHTLETKQAQDSPQSDGDSASTDEAAHSPDKPSTDSAEPSPQEPDDIQLAVDQTKMTTQTAADK